MVLSKSGNCTPLVNMPEDLLCQNTLHFLLHAMAVMTNVKTSEMVGQWVVAAVPATAGMIVPVAVNGNVVRIISLVVVLVAVVLVAVAFISIGVLS